MNTDPTERTAAFNSRKERFSAFLRHTDQKQIQLLAVVEGIRQHAPSVWARATASEGEFHACFVGAGNGGLEIPLIQVIALNRGTLEGMKIYCSDASDAMREEFMTHAHTAGVDTVVERYDTHRFEDPEYRPHQADLLIASHVWYYVEDWRYAPGSFNSLVKFHRTVRDRGVGLITLYSESSDRYELITQLKSIDLQTEQEFPGEAVAEECVRLEIPHETGLMEAQTDVSCCFHNDKFDPGHEGRLLLSFILRADWDDLPKDTRDNIGRKLTEIVKRNGAAKMIFRDLYVWIFPRTTSTG
ncbi:hypothetical protein [Nocardia colli]|uniref:hypothetical protein n=1 Tax=Nocardia colli TaxID=2545717 RepID=UPI0035D9F7CA